MARITSIRTHPRYTQQSKLAFRLPDNLVVAGDTYTEVVQAMSEEKLSTPKSLLSYRKAVARRLTSAYPKLKIATSTDAAFIRSLVRVGQLIDIKEGNKGA